MQETAMVVHEFILREFLPGEAPGELTNEQSSSPEGFSIRSAHLNWSLFWKIALE